jgi:hypothetical protein
MQTGIPGYTDCSQPTGCTVAETEPNSFNEGFGAAGGGVWGAQFDVAGILCVKLYSLCFHDDDPCGRYSIWFWTVSTVFKTGGNIGANMACTACESAGIDPTSYLDFFDRHFGLGNTVRELSRIWLQYCPILRRSAISHRRHPLWRLVSCRLNAGIIDVHDATFRAGLPTVYDPQCSNSGPTGYCVCTPLNGIVLS